MDSHTTQSPLPADYHDFSSINFGGDFASLNYTYETASMSSPRLAFSSLNLSTSNLPTYYSSSSTTGSPSPYVHHSPIITASNSLNFGSQPSRPFSPSQSLATPLPIPGSELASDNLASQAPFSLGAISIGGQVHGRARAMSSGTGSPSSSYASAGSLSGIGPHRTKGYGSGVIRNDKRRRATKREDDDDDDDEEDDAILNGTLPSSEVVVAKRREEIRRQRIESEQRRRDELRDGYRKLKEVLPVSNQKSSKVSLLDRATTHIRYLELTSAQMAQKVQELEAETARLRTVNETLMLSAAERSRLNAPFA